MEEPPKLYPLMEEPPKLYLLMEEPYVVEAFRDQGFFWISYISPEVAKEGNCQPGYYCNQGASILSGPFGSAPVARRELKPAIIKIIEREEEGANQILARMKSARGELALSDL